MIKIRATHGVHNVVFAVRDTSPIWAIISDCLQRMHIHYNLIVKNAVGLRIEILEIDERQPTKPETIDPKEAA